MHRIPIDDDPFDSVPLFQLLRDKPAILDGVHAALADGKTVLIHCQAGAQRSAAVAACYLVAKHGMTPQQAIDHIKARRPVAFFWQANLRRAIELMHDMTFPRPAAAKAQPKGGHPCPAGAGDGADGE